MMDKNMAIALIQLLQRVDIKGAEVPGYTEIFNVINAIGAGELIVIPAEHMNNNDCWMDQYRGLAGVLQKAVIGKYIPKNQGNMEKLGLGLAKLYETQLKVRKERGLLTPEEQERDTGAPALEEVECGEGQSEE